MDKKEFYFDLPPELIAQEPLLNRSDSRLLVMHGKEIEHKRFTDIKNYLRQGDCLVLNDTRVLPARLYGTKKDTGAPIEFLLLKRISLDTWEVILRPGRRAKVGTEFVFSDRLSAKILEVTDTGERIVKFLYDGVFEDILSSVGEVPLPPYITKKLKDKERYQTVYSREEGSAAAPTAGLHFTKELLSEIKGMGVEIAYVTLHVGLGTFRPVKSDRIEDHVMHSESYHIPQEAADKINRTRQAGGRIIAVGTTSVRTLESAAAKSTTLSEIYDDTNIFIYPGYKFKIVNALITNFHLPESTLIMLVSALAGRDTVMHAYNEAIKERYRFFSFGDAMFIY